MRIENVIRSIVLLAFLVMVVDVECGAQHIAKHYKTSKFDSAIFPANSLDMIPGIRFTPTNAEIDTAESALAKDIKTLNTPMINQYRTPIIHKKIGKYRRQYFGYLDQSGHKILLINCFYDKKYNDHVYWLDSKVTVLDGGSYYWSIHFDMNTKKFFEFYVNGAG